MSTDSLKNQLKYISSCNTVSIDNKSSKPVSYFECPKVISNVQDFQCNSLDIDLCQDDQLYPPLIIELYSIPVNEVSVFNNFVNQISASCNVIGSEKSEANKKLMKQKFTYPRIDPDDSGIIDDRSDHQKMASILRICS
jgi:hypothetical protein